MTCSGAQAARGATPSTITRLLSPRWHRNPAECADVLIHNCGPRAQPGAGCSEETMIEWPPFGHGRGCARVCMLRDPPK